MTDFKERIAGLSPKRLALLAVELQKRVERAEARAVEPIAVVGVGCRFPGGASGPEAYWRMLSGGVDGIGRVPSDRWDADELYDPDPKAPGKMVTRGGGFVEGVDQFDAAFFGITPREAASLDPRYRILLEVVWESLEHAGQAPDRLLGSQTGVFVGACGSDYYQLLVEGRPHTLDAYLVSGIATSMAAGRISYALGLQGPALSIDTACSSSLVAVHQACQSLRTSECDMAIASGTSLILAPEVSIGLSSAEMLSPDGHCKTFDAAADGIVRGEGVGAVVLKRLSDAEANGDRVLALIQGTAINQDGRSGGITAPNGPSQEAVIREALRRSDLSPADVGYVEAHGTGTTLGDPIEVRALDTVFSEGRAKDDPLMIGSVKTNFGHLEASAGIAGLIKVVLALDHGRIPPHLHLRQRNPHIEWDDMCLTIPTELTSWGRGDRRRIAGVSSFGFSGTNAHVILEEAPLPVDPEVNDHRSAHILTLSARNAPALDTLIDRFADHLSADGTPPTADICYTANTGRAHFEERVAVVAGPRDDLAQHLQAIRRQEPGDGAFRGRLATPKPPEVVFLFSGNGLRQDHAGRQLYASEPGIRQNIQRCADLLQPLLGDGIRSVLSVGSAADSIWTDDPRIVHAATFAWQYALAELWKSWGVKPAVALGYGMGDFAAACAAGVFDLEDALALVVKRAELAAQEAKEQVLCAVFDAASRVAADIEPSSGQLRIVAINGSAHTVVSGRKEQIEALREEVTARGIETRVLEAKPTFLAGSALDDLERDIADRPRGMPAFGLISCLTGEVARPSYIQDPKYWREQCSGPVDFDSAMRMLADHGYRLFIEVGPDVALLPLARQIVAAQDARWLPSLRPGQDDWTQLSRSVAELYAQGVDIDWRSYHHGCPRRIVSLPTYPFQHKSYWVARPSQQAVTTQRAAWRDWLYEHKWRTLGLRSADARDLKSPERISQDTSREIEALSDLNQVEIYKEFAPKLDALCSAYIIDALRDLGWKPGEADGPITAESVRESLGILPEHGRLVNRMLEILAEDGVLESRTDGSWTFADEPVPQDTSALAAELCKAYPECAAELDLTISCARPLAEVLSGKVDPMQLLFPEGSLAPTERLYQESAGLRLFNSLAREAIASACSELGPNRKIRILELGAGTGAATSYILPVLRPEQTEYVFTDVSHAFLTAAQKKFAEYPFIEYRLLDAGNSALEQGFAEGEFDIVIAANVIHATPDLRRTLGHIKEVLAPDGLVVLLEGTVRQRFGDLTVGLTPGWWSFTDVDLRPSYALLTAPQWCELFLACGFASVATIPDGKHPLGGAVNQQSVLVARAAGRNLDERAGSRSGDWLIFCDEGGTGDALAATISADGGHCVTVRKGDAFQDAGSGEFAVNPAEPQDFRTLLDTLSGNDELSLRGVVHCWALDETVPSDLGIADLELAERRACGSALHLAQALASKAGGPVPRLFLLTRQSQAVSTDEACPGFAQAALWGLARVIELEHAELRCVVADLDAGPADTSVQQLLDQVLLADSLENQLAFREDRLLTLRAAPSDGIAGDAAGELEVVADASYVVTGGLSGLGLLVANWLVDRGARHLVLVGRRPPGDEASASIAAMIDAGASIRIVQGNVATAECVEAIEKEIAATGMPLRGIVHCAGTIDDGALLQQDWTRFQSVMAAKVFGSWNLHRLSESWATDFFVLFSTGASFLGSPGQSNHAAANAFMDALAHYRRGLGLPALTINWGAWGETGAAVRTGVADFAVASGMGTISSKQGLAILDYLLSGDHVTQVAVLPATPARLVSTHDTGRPMPIFEELVQIAASSSGEESDLESPEARSSELLNSLGRASPKARKALLVKTIQQAAVKVMGLRDGEVIDPRRPLIDLGLDSLMAVELRNAISRLIGRTLPATLLFNYPSIVELTDHLLVDVLELMSSEEGDTRDAAAEQQAARDAELNRLGEDEIADLLESRLTDLEDAG